MNQVYSHALLVTGARSWDDEPAMRQTFTKIWNHWAREALITHPVLISGHCPADSRGRGADVMAERLWHEVGFDVIAMPADWQQLGRTAGFKRNTQMVETLLRLCEAGTEIAAAAFLDLCDRSKCPAADQDQLMPQVPGHFSHGTIHCRGEVIARGVEVRDVIHPRLPPF